MTWDQESEPPIGLVAGWGRFPVQVAEAIVEQGRGVVCIAIKGHADPALEYICDHVQWSGVGKLGGHQRYFRRFHVREVTLAGKLFKNDLLFRGPVIWRHLPDWTCVKTFAPLLLGNRRDARDDSLLTAVTESYSKRNMTIRPATEIAPRLLVDEGTLTAVHLKPRQRSDVDFGWRIARQMGGLDIGQSIAVLDGTVLAVEAIEGTDACIQRAGELCPKGGWTLVKVAKPQQDMRFDVPTIGPLTVENVAKAKGRAIAIEAGKTIVVDYEKTTALAARHGIALVAFSAHEMERFQQQMAS